MSRPYRLDVRLAVVVTAISALTLFAIGTALTLEFTRGQFSIEERGLSAQTLEWALRVHPGPSNTAVFDRPQEPLGALDHPYTGLLAGKRPIYGYVLVDADGRVLDRSEAKAPAGRPVSRTQEPEISTGPALDGSGPLLVADAYVPDAGVWLRVGRARSDINALANTFFVQLLTELGWAALAILLVMIVTAVAIVRVSLIGLRRVAAQAERITFENLRDERLDGASAPMEVQALIRAVNHALDSIQAGASAQRDFSIHAAHELRTPLADLRLRIDGLPPSADRTAAIRDIDAMARLFEQLLNVARLDGGATFTLETVDLAEAVAKILQEAAPRLVTEGRTIEAEGLEHPVHVRGDLTLIALVVRNLLENFHKHTPLNARLKVRLEPNGSLSFDDTGPGLPVALRGARFVRFARGVDDVRSGSGLGLSICDTAMSRMGGSFKLEPTVSGCRFIAEFQRGGDAPD